MPLTSMPTNSPPNDASSGGHERWPHLAAYGARLLARPTVKIVVDGGRPFRSFFPPGVPERD